MTTAGWIIMVASLTVVWSVTIWAYRKLLSSPRDERDD